MGSVSVVRLLFHWSRKLLDQLPVMSCLITQQIDSSIVVAPTLEQSVVHKHIEMVSSRRVVETQAFRKLVSIAWTLIHRTQNPHPV